MQSISSYRCDIHQIICVDKLDTGFKIRLHINSLNSLWVHENKKLNE